MITNFYPPYNFGGDGVYVHRLSNELARRGHRVDVIHCKDAYHAFEPTEPSEPYHDHPNVTVHGLESGWGILSPLLTQQTGRPLLKAAKIERVLQQGFDVIHYHNFSLVGGPAVLRYGTGVKLCSAHDHWLVCQTRVLFRFERAACARRDCFLCNLWHRKPPQWWRYTGLLHSALEHIDALIVGSQFTITQMRQLGPNVPIVHLPYFAPQPQPLQEAAPDPPEAPYFLFVGRLVKLKGLQTLIPIFRRWGKAPLLVAGTGRYEHQLRQLASGDENIRFLGHLSPARLQQLYRGAVAVIIPSITYEVGTLVMFESLSHGTPIIVRNLGGLPEHVVQSGGGFVYDSDEQLIAAMEQLLANPSLRHDMGQRGRQTYLQKWTPEAHVEGYLALVQDIAERSTCKRANA